MPINENFVKFYRETFNNSMVSPNVSFKDIFMKNKENEDTFIVFPSYSSFKERYLHIVPTSINAYNFYIIYNAQDTKELKITDMFIGNNFLLNNNCYSCIENKDIYIEFFELEDKLNIEEYFPDTITNKITKFSLMLEFRVVYKNGSDKCPLTEKDIIKNIKNKLDLFDIKLLNIIPYSSLGNKTQILDNYEKFGLKKESFKINFYKELNFNENFLMKKDIDYIELTYDELRFEKNKELESIIEECDIKNSDNMYEENNHFHKQNNEKIIRILDLPPLKLKKYFKNKFKTFDSVSGLNLFFDLYDYSLYICFGVGDQYFNPNDNLISLSVLPFVNQYN